MSDGDDLLSDDDARILALESAVLTGHTLKLMVLAPGPPVDLERLRATVQSRLAAQPHALDRVDGGGQGMPPRWMAAEDFDIAEHVRRRAGTECATTDDLRRVASALMSEHLDRDRPLWTLDLIGPLADGREAIAARMHHAMVDGIAGMRFLDGILFDPHAASAAPVPAHRSDPGERAAAHEWRRLPAAIAREWGRPGSRSPFDRPITGARELAFTSAPLDGLRRIGASRPSHATINDVLLATVAGGLRTWLDEHARHLDLRAQVPVSLHHRDEGAGGPGNRDSFINVDLRLDVDDPLTRLDLISAATRREKQAGDAALMYDLLHSLGTLPAANALAHRISDSPREFSLAVSNVPGPRDPVAVASRRVVALYSSSEPGAHHALRIAAISNAGHIGIGFCTDPTAVARVDALADAVGAAYSELDRVTAG